MKKRTQHGVRALAAILLGAAALAGCSADSAAQRAGEDGDRVVATIDGEPITMAELRAEVGDQLRELDFQYRQQRHQILQEALDEAVQRRLLEAEATARGVTLDKLITSETAGKIDVSDEQVADWYRRNQEALGGRSLESLEARIREYLIELQRRRVLRDLAMELAAGKDVSYLLEPARAEFNNEGAPAFGPADASVTLVEFSDFECPYCGRFFETLNQIKENYGDRVRIVYRQYPLDNIHPHASGAALASLCAHEQGRFWEMHDLLFTEQDRLAIDDLKEKAGRLGLDQAAFDACLDSRRYVEQIERDIREGDVYGVTGTPAIFVNGVQIRGGAVPYEVMAEIIDEELGKVDGS